MALHAFSRTELLVGKPAMERLAQARVAVFGIGGVGGYTVEALARSGVGALDLIDDDRVCLTNINRQIIATRKTVGDLCHPKDGGEIQGRGGERTHSPDQSGLSGRNPLCLLHAGHCRTV